MNATRKINHIQQARIRRVRARIRGTALRPRCAIFRSNRGIGAQMINDDLGRTIVSVSEREIKRAKGMTKTDVARAVGVLLAEKAKNARILRAVLDRRSYRYHGRVKACVDAARKAGLSV
jgi:large subunit ribosomal protein L18